MTHSMPSLLVAVSMLAGCGGTLRNTGLVCEDEGVITPASGEEGHLAAARFTPRRYPYEVDAVRVTLVHGQSGLCSASGSYRIALFASASSTPPSEPDILEEWTFDPAPVAGTTRTLQGEAEPPITIDEGEHIYVVFDYSGQVDPPACLLSCQDNPEAGRNFWSNADEPPYEWATLASLGIDGAYEMQVDGH